MTDTDQLDDLWRDTLRDVAEVGDGAGAPARVRDHVRSRARRRHTLQSMAAVCVAVVVAASAVALRRDDGTRTSAPPASSVDVIGTITIIDRGMHLTATSRDIPLQGNPPDTI